MTGSRHTGEGLDARRKKLLFRSWHRGMREMDLLLGSFADARIGSLTGQQIDQYEKLLDVVDTELLPFLTGEQPIPAGEHTQMLNEIAAFRQTLRF
jgi:antitoxin CptB